MMRRVNIDEERHKRELRQRLARSRRRIDADTRAVGRATLGRLAWRTQVRRHPLASLGVAAGVGVAMAMLPSLAGLARGLGDIGRGWMRRLVSYATLRVVARALRAWRASGSKIATRNTAAGEETR